MNISFLNYVLWCTMDIGCLFLIYFNIMFRYVRVVIVTTVSFSFLLFVCGVFACMSKSASARIY